MKRGLLVLLSFAALTVASSVPWSLTQYNATLTLLTKPIAMGQYVSGDWWLVGPVTIISTSPAAADGRNGFEVSPKSVHAQPYDNRASYFNASLLPTLPLVVAPGDNIVKMVSLPKWPSPSNPTFISSATIVTIVASPPPPGSFRPGYFRGNPAAAARQWSTAQLRWELYPSRALPPAPKCPPAPAAQCEPPPSLDAAVTQRYAMPQIDHLFDYSGDQIHPVSNMPGCHYGEAIVQAAGLAAARLLLDDHNASAKAAAAQGLVQYGLDLGSIIAGGGSWPANGGWANGRKLVLGLATLVLGETNMSALAAGVATARSFSEDTEIWANGSTVLWGSPVASPGAEEQYWKLVVSGNGFRIQADPYGAIDGGPVPGGYYDFCCVFKPWKGEALPQLMSAPLAAIIDSPNMLTFVQRRITVGTWALPDPCAPPTGECSDGSGRCSGWLGSPCGGKGGKCVLDLKDYGVLYGPNNATPGHCIAGKGRFPDLHGANKDMGDGAVDLVERLYAAFVVAAAPPPTPTPTPFPLPKWAPTYNMSLSTAYMPCDILGVGPVPFPPALSALWGIADFDWSNGAQWWAAQAPMAAEETLLAQAEASHALNPAAKVFVYRNSVKALASFASVRAKLLDRAYERWFLPLAACKDYSCTNSSDPLVNANLYYSDLQTYNVSRGDCGVGLRCTQYFFDVRNESLRTWLASSEYLFGPTALGSPAIHGFYFDDLWYGNGTGDMPPGVIPEACGLSPADIKDLESASVLSRTQMNAAVVAAGGWSWQQFLALPEYPNTIATAQANCASFMRAYSGAESPTQSRALLHTFSMQNKTAFWPLPYPTQDTAQFLLVRGPYAWLGYGWSSCRSPGAYERPPEVDVDYGEPLGFSAETAPGSGVWAREYTKYSVTLNCNTWAATLTPKFFSPN